MAAAITNAIRLRKTLTLFRRVQLPAASTVAASHNILHPGVAGSKPNVLFSSGVEAAFRYSGRAAFSSSRFAGGNEEIGPDTILFEGCDYNHWLITMDFPKDPKPTPEEMVRTYEETCAKGLGITIEEARKRMYACSTTTYQGFQAIMTEEESEKFRGIPGVVFILPDSYIDPVNKEYGGDKYENGVITHRPPPVQYRREGGRFRDRNRNPDQPRFDRQGGSMPNRAQNYGPPGSQQNVGPAQNYPPQQNYGSPRSPQGYPVQQGFGQPGQPGPGAQQTYAPQQSFSQQGNQQGYPPQQDYALQGAPRSYPPPQNHGPQGYPTQQNYGPPGGRDSMPPPHVNYNQYSPGPQESRAPAGRGYPGADNRNYSPTNNGPFGQQNYGSNGQNYPGEAGRNPQVDQANTLGQQNNFMPMGHTGGNQGRY